MPTALTETASPIGHNSKNAAFTPPKPPANLPKRVHKDWKDLCHHLHDTGSFGPAKLPLIEVYLLALNCIREAQQQIADEGAFTNGKPHPAMCELQKNATTMSKFSLLLNLKAAPATQAKNNVSDGGDDPWKV